MTDGAQRGIVLAAIAGLLWWLWPRSQPQVTVSVTTAGGVPVSSITYAELQQYLDLDVIAPDEADAIMQSDEGLPADPNALANGIAKINSWLAAGGQVNG